MRRDLRATAFYQEAEELYRTLRQPGTGQISDASEIHVAPSGRYAVFAGAFLDGLDGNPFTRICRVDLVSGDTRVLTFGPNTDRSPKYSPDGRQIAFLSDRDRSGGFRAYLLDPDSGAAQPLPPVEGWVEYLDWSPDGRKLLLGVAGHGADIAGAQGAVTSKKVSEDVPPWMPTVESGSESLHWRRAWVYDLPSRRMFPVGSAHLNVWEAVWCGNESFAAVVSSGPSEGLWYGAVLSIVDIEAGNTREVYRPADQLGWLSASPSGNYLAIVEALCSDRGLVAGDLRLIDTSSGEVQRVNTARADITYTEWRSDHRLLLAGHREFETVVGLYDLASATFRELWHSHDLTTGGRYVSVAGCGPAGDCALIGESFVRAPEIAVLRQGDYQPVKSFDVGYCGLVAALEAAHRVSWSAPDALEIQGWLLRPKGASPHPTIMYIHGGPVWHWRPTWLGRWGAPVLMLLRRGYAVFLPNPRGSGGRGQDFARHVLGDMGGADTHDYLSGIDYLVAKRMADPERLGVIGGSYGGFMSAWLITQDSRFAAAVAVAPVTNQVTEHLISNIPHFVSLFLADTYTNPGGKYYQRSPIMHAHRVTTPTLIVCGALDRCTPPEEAVQLHNALLENKVKSVLINYPQEGHGIRGLPAAIDYAARVVSWFEEHMPSRVNGVPAE
jgi:dipeptidyl aminopeptidase/acylaminoacyl peptidase